MTVPKYLGRDCELSTTGIAPGGNGIDSYEVAREILQRVESVFAPRPVWSERSAWSGWSGGGGAWSTDDLRHWTPNGQCYYCDLAHVEVCTAETLDPLTFAAQSLATLLVAEEARARAESEAPAGTCYCLSAAGIDLIDPAIAWGAHLNVSVSSELWEDLFLDSRHSSRLRFVASAVAAAVVFFGCGTLAAEPAGSGAADRAFGLSARAHHLTRLITLATTVPYARGLLNSRREPHSTGQERLHLIGFDFTLAGSALLASFLQCALLAAEEGFAGQALSSPVDAVQRWSRGLDPLTGRVSPAMPLANGGRVTLAGYVKELVRLFREMLRSGLIEGAQAPRAEEHLERIAELAVRLERGELESCARHLDWAAKFVALRALAARDDRSLDSAAMRLLDHDFASTDPARGLFWRLWAAGDIDPLVTPEAVEAQLADGPEDSRAWTRGRLIQRFGPRLRDVDWSRIELASGPAPWERRFVHMPRPDSLDRARAAAWLERARDEEELLRDLAHETPSPPLVERADRIEN